MKREYWQRAAVFVTCAALAVSLAACGKDKKKSGGVDVQDFTPTAQAGNSDTGETVASGKDGGKSTRSRTEYDDYTMTTTTTTVTTKKKTTAKKTTTTTTAATTTSTTKAAPKRDNSYKVTTKTYTSDDGKIKYSYPKISGLYDSAMQKYYNSLFKSDMTAAVEDIGKGTLTMEYDVTLKSKDYLSIVFRGGVFYEGAAHPYAYAYAYTINLATGETIVPSEQVSMSQAADAILEDKWSLVRAADGVEKQHIVDYFTQLGEEGTKNAITESKVISVRRDGSGEFSVQGQNVCRSYLDSKTQPVLILELNHALGDYAEVRLS